MHGKDIREFDTFDFPTGISFDPIVFKELAESVDGQKGLEPGILVGMADEEAHVGVVGFVAGTGVHDASERRFCGCAQ